MKSAQRKYLTRLQQQTTKWARLISFVCISIILCAFIKYLDGMKISVQRIPSSATLQNKVNKVIDYTCADSWVLKHINTSMQQQVEKRTAEWYDSLPLQLERAYDKVSSQQSGNPKPSNEPDKWDRFDVMMPVMAGACEMQRMPEMSDDGKFICGIKDIPNEAQRPCIVYSIGSADRWDFEAAIYKSTACEIHTFDCTVDSAHIPEEIQDRVMFHKVCIGNSSKSDSSNNLIFMNLKEIMDSLGHTYMTLLKADIEGYEYGMFNEILLEDDVELPEQISFELHYRVAPNSHLTWKSREKTAGEIALFAIRLYEQGYRVLSREDNRLCSHCTEFTVARFRCPKGSRSMIKNIESLQSNP